MKRTVAVVDYGMGNLRSVSQAVMHVARDSGVGVIVTSNPDDVYAAERVVLPGQGAMPDCMRELRESGLQDAVLHAAANKPLMGVCVGMQMLLSRSEEGPPGVGTSGLGLVDGEVIRFQLEGPCLPDASIELFLYLLKQGVEGAEILTFIAIGNLFRLALLRRRPDRAQIGDAGGGRHIHAELAEQLVIVDVVRDALACKRPGRKQPLII